MKIRIDNYRFSASSKTVTFSDYSSIRLDAVLLITNVATNTIIYNFADPSKGGTVSGNVLTLDYSTIAMSDSDPLQILYDDTLASSFIDTTPGLKKLLTYLASPPWVDKSANQLRAQVTGTISTVTTVTTVTTCSSVTNFGTYPAQQLVIDQNRTAWAEIVRRKFT